MKALSHIAIRANDLDESLHFYRDILGLEEAFRLCGDDGKPFLIYIYISPYQFIELFPNGERPQERGRDVSGFQHFCLEVENVEEAYRLLQERGAPIDSEIQTGKSKCRQFWTHDPDGCPIELMQMLPESEQYRATQRFLAQRGSAE